MGILQHEYCDRLLVSSQDYQEALQKSNGRVLSSALGSWNHIWKYCLAKVIKFQMRSLKWAPYKWHLKVLIKGNLHTWERHAEQVYGRLTGKTSYEDKEGWRIYPLAMKWHTKDYWRFSRSKGKSQHVPWIELSRGGFDSDLWPSEEQENNLSCSKPPNLQHFVTGALED